MLIPPLFSVLRCQNMDRMQASKRPLSEIKPGHDGVVANGNNHCNSGSIVTQLHHALCGLAAS